MTERTLAPLNKLNLKMLTLKTVILCALTSAQRKQTFDLNFRKEFQNSISFVLNERLKSSWPGKHNEVSFFGLCFNLSCSRVEGILFTL